MTAFRSDLGAWPSRELVDQVKYQVEESLPTCSKMGEHAVVITDAEQYLRRVARAAQREDWQHFSALVKYYDSYPSDVAFGDGQSFMPAFLKPREYELEREFRIALNTRTVGDDHVTLDIGDIHDIGWYAETRGAKQPAMLHDGDLLPVRESSMRKLRAATGQATPGPGKRKLRASRFLV